MQAHDIKEEQALRLEQDDQHEADVYMEEPEQNQEVSENEHAQDGDGQDYGEEYKEEPEDGNGYQDDIYGDLGAEGDAGRPCCMPSSNDRLCQLCDTTRTPHAGCAHEIASCGGGLYLGGWQTLLLAYAVHPVRGGPLVSIHGRRRELLTAGDGADAGYGGEDDYGQVYDDIDAGEDPQVEEEAMQEQAEAPEDYADDEDLYNDIVPGIGQVDGVRICNWHTLSMRCQG